MSSLPEILAPLAILSTARRNAAQYYAPFLDSADELVRVGAWYALLDRGEVSYEQYPRIVELAGQYAGLQRSAYQYFLRFYEYGHAALAATATPPPQEGIETRLRQSELAVDMIARAEALRDLYLATGRQSDLTALYIAIDQQNGWRAALPIAVNAAMLNPHDPMIVLDLLHYIYEARDADLMDAAVSVLEKNNLHPHHALLYSAMSKLMRGNPGGCLKSLATLATARISRPDVAARLRYTALRTTGEALEKLKDYRRAYNAYVEMNAVETSKAVGLDEFGTMVEKSAILPVPKLPADHRTGYFVMTGFPRSGTTLLENVFGAHPSIETFEETPAGMSIHIYLDRILPTLAADAGTAPIYLEARSRYYREMDRLRAKQTASVFIDKMPMHAAEAKFMVKLFPDKRYIFSIRHPFDVVLSCFKQQFQANIAMVHFRTFETAVKLYDFSMQQWFSVFGMEDQRVHYVRYDQLVTEFEPTVRGALGFLGLEWDDAVQNFAQAAEHRHTKTPSYQKVRQGLSIGVQTQWRNYGFLFQSEAARPLRKWVEHFGYHAE